MESARKSTHKCQFIFFYTFNRLRTQRPEVSVDDNHQLFNAGRFDNTGHWAVPPTRWHDDSPEALLTQEEFFRCLEKTLENLPEHQRVALMLRDQAEMSLNEICNILSVTSSNIRVLIHPPRARLHAVIEHFEETGKC